MRTCLLHQKLQILNVCIDRKLLQQSTTGGQVVDSNERNDSDDEFYDCDEDEQQQQNIVNDEGDESECPIYIIFSIVLLTTIYDHARYFCCALLTLHTLFIIFLFLSTTNYLSLQILAFNHRGRPSDDYRNSAQ